MGTYHYSDVIMSVMVSQITGVSIIYSTHCSCTDQRKYQSSASLAFVRGIHRSPVNSPHKGPVTQKMFPFDDIIMIAPFKLVDAYPRLLTSFDWHWLDINSLWPGDAIWRHGTRSTLAQVMACCLTAPSHYLNQCWLIFSKVHWHSVEGNLTRDSSPFNH